MQSHLGQDNSLDEDEGNNLSPTKYLNEESANTSKKEIDSQKLQQLVQKLNTTENKINVVKRNINESYPKEISKKQKEVTETSTKLIQEVSSHPISATPNLQKHIQDGIEAYIVRMGTELHKLKNQNSELIETIKQKNIFINTIEEDCQKYKKLSEDQAQEIKDLKDQVTELKKELGNLNKKVYLQSIGEEKGNEIQQILRKPKANEKITQNIGSLDLKKGTIQNANDPYDFWKTQDDEGDESNNLDHKSESKLTSVIGAKNKLWLEKVNQDLNFEAVSLPTQKGSTVGGNQKTTNNVWLANI